MLKNYFKIAIRNLLKQKGLAFINIFGLSIGIACFTLFVLYAVNEFSYDRFHANADYIYRVYQWDESANEGNTSHPMPLGPAMKRELPGLKDYVRIRNAWRESFIKTDDNVSRAKISFADQQFFSVFSFKFKEGSAATALNGLYNVVLTEQAAEKIWGRADVVGKTIEIKVQDKFEPFVVSAVIENIPSNSSIAFEMLGSFDFLTTVTPDGKGQANSWGYSSSQTYLQFEDGKGPVSRKTLDAFYNAHNAESIKEDVKNNIQNRKWYGFQPLKSIHTETKLKGANVPAVDPQTIWILLGIAGGVLLIACINFTTLAIGRSADRSKEVGVRKVMGGTRRSLAFQFIMEASFLTILSAGLGLLLSQALLPFFNELSGKELQFSISRFPELIWLAAGLTIVIALLTGSYPALVLSRFQPVEVLKTKLKLGGSNFFTKSLVTIQFVLSAGLIIATWTILQQVNFMQSKAPGFNKENIIVVDADGTWPRQIYPFFKQQLTIHPEIVGITGSDQRLGGTSYSNTDIKLEGKPKKIYEFFVADGFLDIMNMKLLVGRNFDPSIASDTLNSVIINETMMREFGWTANNVVGQTIKNYRTNIGPVVIGVIKDFNYQPFSMKVEPQLFHQFAKNRPYKYFVRVKPGDPSRSLVILEASWKKIVPDFPFRYTFLDENLLSQYKAETRWSRIIGWAGGISIFLACLGLFGLASLAVINRAKEIGIRKVLGASVLVILRTISKEFLILVSVALIIASALAWFFMHQWLQDYAYRINLNWWVFAITAAAIVGTALLVVSLQAIRIAMASPVKSLKAE